MRAAEKIKIFIVDDHQLVIDGLCSLLLNEPEFEVVGSCNSSSDVLAKLDKKEVDIVITDIQMPGISGVELTRIILKKHSRIYILALSMHGSAAVIKQMVDSGISGYILKNTGKEELRKALITIAKGETYFSLEIGRELRKAGKKDKGTHLTSREIEIIRLIAKDMCNKEMAGLLNISERTVETHRKNILKKTDTQTAVGLIRFAHDNKII